jgi:hypothetical protein
LRAHSADVTLFEQPLRPAMAGRGAGVHPLGNLCVSHAPIRLHQTENFEIHFVELIGDERIFRLIAVYWTTFVHAGFSTEGYCNQTEKVESTFPFVFGIVPASSS